MTEEQTAAAPMVSEAAPAAVEAAAAAPKKIMKPRQAVRRVAVDGTETFWPSINSASGETEIGLTTLRRLLETGEFHRSGARFYFAPFEPAGAGKRINVGLSDETYAWVEKNKAAGERPSDFIRSVLNALANGDPVI